MGFREDVYSYFDQDGLMGNQPNPGKWTGGNELLDTSIAMMLLWINGYLRSDDVDKFRMAVDRCRLCSDGTILPEGIYNKNPLRDGQMTHDDLKGVAVASHVIEEDTIGDAIYAYGKETDWVQSNTGSVYFTAITKPWNVAFYTLCADRMPNLWMLAVFFLKALLSCFRGLKDPSGIRQNWLHYHCIMNYTGSFRDPISYLLYLGSILCMLVWRYRVKKVWPDGMRGVMKAYHGESHPFARQGLSYF